MKKKINITINKGHPKPLKLTITNQAMTTILTQCSGLLLVNSSTKRHWPISSRLGPITHLLGSLPTELLLPGTFLGEKEKKKRRLSSGTSCVWQHCSCVPVPPPHNTNRPAASRPVKTVVRQVGIHSYNGGPEVATL